MEEYEFHEFPKVVYRDRPKGFKAPQEGAWVPPEPFETRIVTDHQDEAEAIEEGWRLTPVREKAVA